MRPAKPVRVLPVVISLLTTALALSPQTTFAACNEPPEIPPERLFNPTTLLPGEKGSIDSPLLVPGKKVNGNPRIRTVQTSELAAGDVVSIAFFPANGAGTPKLLVFADACASTNVSACGNNAACVKSKSTIDLGAKALSFEVPDQFEFNSDLLAGPVRVAVTPAQSIPCDLTDATKTCAGLPNLHACIQHLTPPGGTPDRNKFLSVTALPPSNDFSKICKNVGGPDRCKTDKDGVHMAVDAEGNLLIPMDWSKVIRKKANPNDPCQENGTDCEKRDVNAVTTLPAFANSATGIHIVSSESQAHLQTFNESGGTFQHAPEFQSALPDNAPLGQQLKMAGDIDKPYSVLRIRRCPTSAGNCLTPKFDIAYRATNGGPIVIANPKKEWGKGTCDAPAGKICEKKDDCDAGSACVRAFGETEALSSAAAPIEAEAPAPALPEEEAVVPPPPPPAPDVASPPPADSPLPYWIAVLAILAVAWIFVRRRGI